MKKFAYGCGVFLVLVPLIGGIVLWRLTRPPQRIASNLPATPEERARQKAAVQELRVQIEAIHQKARQGAKSPFELRLTEEQLNALLAQGAEKGAKFDVENLAARIEPHLLTLQGTAHYKGTPVTLTLTGNLTTAGSQIDFQTQSLWLGGFPAPEKWRREASHFVSKQINKGISKDVARLDEVTVAEDAIIIRGVTR